MDTGHDGEPRVGTRCRRTVLAGLDRRGRPHERELQAVDQGRQAHAAVERERREWLEQPGKVVESLLG